MDASTRTEAFRFMLGVCYGMPDNKSEIPVVGALLMVGIIFLIGKEKEARESLKAIANQEFVRRTEISRIAPWLKKRRGESICSILACTFYFSGVVPSDDMLDIVNLLASLAVDSSLKELNDILSPIIRDTVLEDIELWRRLEQEFPAACKMIEADLKRRP